MMKIVLGLALAVALAASSRVAVAEKYLIDHEVWGWYQQYLRNTQNGNKPGAFAITKDGSSGEVASCPAGGSYSGGGACEPVKGSPQELASREALKRCGGAQDCVLLYVGQQKQGNIEIVAR